MSERKKLVLNRESLRRLSADEGLGVNGGITYDGCGTATCATCLKIGCPGGPTGRCSEALSACLTCRLCPVQ